jgi:1-acyl-sn-glycerol-3-phosphate acyltransferase
MIILMGVSKNRYCASGWQVYQSTLVLLMLLAEVFYLPESHYNCSIRRNGKSSDEKDKFCMMRALLRTIIRFIFWLLSDTTITGAENIPDEGACILTINHLGIVDAPLVYILFERDDATGLVGLAHKENPILRWLVTQVDGIWIDRENPDVRALKEARSYLRKGWLLGIAPEGTRSDTHALIEAKPGVAFLADKMQGVLVPIGISGTEGGLGRMFAFQRPKFTVIVGEPYRLPRLEREDRDASLQRNTDEIMCRIAALLPPAYRGVYAEHPRLKELIANSQ